LQEYWRICSCLCIKIERLKVEKLLSKMVHRQIKVYGVW